MGALSPAKSSCDNPGEMPVTFTHRQSVIMRLVGGTFTALTFGKQIVS